MEKLYQDLFWFMFIAYLIGFFSYAFFFSFKKAIFQKTGLWMFAVGLFLQTFAFVVKWGIVGSIRFQNMFEHLMLMSWAGVGIMIFVIIRYKSSIVGVIISPIIVMLNAAAALLDSTPAENLMPALQSNWLTIHISMAALGSGAFIVAGAVSLLYLLKDHKYSSEIGEQKKMFFSQAMIFMVYIPLVIFLILKITNLTPHHTAYLVMQKFTSRIDYDSARTILGQLVAILGLLMVPMLGIFSYFFKQKSDKSGYGGILFAIYMLSFALGSLIVGILSHNGMILITPAQHQGSIWRFFEFLGSVYVLILVLFPILYYFIYIKLGPKINKMEGNQDLFDEINYRAVSLGYPLYTVGALFAGAIWAEQAWGSFWSWDPKEVGALLVWFFYSAALHARYNRDWRGGRLAILSVIGTVMIFITFYGNYFFGGLHAYS